MAESTTPESARATLADRVRHLAYLYQPDDPFTLASGRVSPHFFDMKPVTVSYTHLTLPTIYSV